MKRTASMIYSPSAVADDLYLTAINRQETYSAIRAVVANLERKINKGIYDAERATEAFYHVATYTAQIYNRLFGYKPTVTERWTAAQDLRDTYITI